MTSESPRLKCVERYSEIAEFCSIIESVVSYCLLTTGEAPLEILKRYIKSQREKRDKLCKPSIASKSTRPESSRS